MLKKYKDYYRKNRNVLVHRGTVLENLFTTELQTAEIIECGESFGVSAFALLVTTNILDAWRYILQTEAKSDLYVLKQIHKRVSKGLLEPPYHPKDRSSYSGKFRDFPVRVATSKGYYMPPTYKESDIRASLDSRSYLTVGSVLKVYADVCKAQFFGDCNKRTSYLFVNYLLAKNDMGYFFLVPDISDYREYISAMMDYYDGVTTSDEIVRFLSKYLVKV